MRARIAAGSVLVGMLCGCHGTGAVGEPDTSAADPEPALFEQDLREQGLTSRMSGDGVFFVASPIAERPFVRYVDGQRSLNQSCAIKLGNKLNRRVPPLFVNGQPVGFC